VKPLQALAEDLANGRATSRALVDASLERIADPAGEGKRVFTHVDAEGARAQADFADAQRKRGVAPSPYAGIPISIKDLFDVQGQVTRAGSTVLAKNAPATQDAPAVARLRAAGFVLIGRTNMTEFAYSGIGINPHYGTPLNAYDRKTGRVPGGSTSGGAISVTDDMAAAALGTDTGGSLRIPPAFNGLVGFKPTARRVSLKGAVPLSFSLDSIGPIGRTVSCCAIVDAVISGEREAAPVPPVHPVKGLRLAVPQSFVLDDVEPVVMAAFEAALAALRKAGALIDEIPLTELLELPKINAKGGFSAPEAYAWHRKYLESQGDDYDPRVRVRIMKGTEQSAADYIELTAARADLIRRVGVITAPYDALVMPTVAIVAPNLQELIDSDAAFTRANLLALRNTSVGNFLDQCAISLPCHKPGEAPVGFMLMGAHGNDAKLLSIAGGVAGLLPAGQG
jgi:aspartyl-tRNA(Asn)/glutamyl-tRNA(Gln) amidotransferase subunit A